MSRCWVCVNLSGAQYIVETSECACNSTLWSVAYRRSSGWLTLQLIMQVLSSSLCKLLVRRDSTAERYSMLMKVMRFCHPDSDQLDLSFEVDGAGAVKMPGSGSGKPPRELLKVSIDECKCVSQNHSSTEPQQLAFRPVLLCCYTFSNYKFTNRLACCVCFTCSY